MHFNFKFIMLIITLILEYVYSHQIEGVSCYIRALNEDGVCTIISSCPSAIDLIHSRRIIPQTCGHKNRIPIICCQNDNGPNTTTVRSITTTVPNTSSTETEIPQIGHKSRQKCKEYAKYVYADSMIDLVPEKEPPPPTAECEIQQIENIVGDKPARLKEFPHMALLGFERNNTLHWKCGGSLISENYILSVAHCQSIKDYGPSTHVLLGELTLNSEADVARPQKIPIEHIIPHDEYTPHDRYNDIALYKLQYNAILNPYVRPACLNTNSARDISLSISSRWGNSSMLEKVVLNQYTNEECNYVYRNSRYQNLRRGISEKIQICAGSRYEFRDFCLGDSGGPLQIIEPSEAFCTHIIVGIYSFGRFCGMRDNPGVYTRVSHYIEWIEGIVWP